MFVFQAFKAQQKETPKAGGSSSKYDLNVVPVKTQEEKYVTINMSNFIIKLSLLNLPENVDTHIKNQLLSAGLQGDDKVEISESQLANLLLSLRNSLTNKDGDFKMGLKEANKLIVTIVNKALMDENKIYSITASLGNGGKEFFISFKERKVEKTAEKGKKLTEEEQKFSQLEFELEKDFEDVKIEKNKDGTIVITIKDVGVTDADERNVPAETGGVISKGSKAHANRESVRRVADAIYGPGNYDLEATVTKYKYLTSENDPGWRGADITTVVALTPK